MQDTEPLTYENKVIGFYIKEKNSDKDAKKRENSMIQAINFNFQTRENPGITGIYAVANNPANKVEFQHYVEKHCPEKDKLYKEEMAAQGVTVVTRACILAAMSPQAKLAEILRSSSRTHVTHPNGEWISAMEEHLGNKNYEKYINLAFMDEKLEALRFQAATAEYVGMSEAEIARSIFNRYENAFGDFRKVWAVGYPATSTNEHKDGAYKIYNQFRRELESVFGSMEVATANYRKALYGNMSNSEIRAEIASKYPPAGKLTLRELHYMVQEMEDVGVGDGFMRVFKGHEAMLKIGGVLSYESLLDRPVDISLLGVMSGVFNEMRNSAHQGIFQDTGVTNDIIKLIFGINLDNMSSASSISRNLADYGSFIEEQKKKYYENWTAKDFEEWFLELFQKEYDEVRILLYG